MANRRCFQTLTRCIQSIKSLPPLSQAPAPPSVHGINRALAAAASPNYAFSNDFRVCQRATVLVRNFSSKPTDTEDDDEDTDDEDYDEIEDEGKDDEKESVVLSAEDKEKEAAEIGYKVIGPLQKSERVFKPYEPVFAVVQIGSHQFKVSNRDTIYTERLKFCDINDKVVLNKVLMLGSQSQTDMIRQGNEPGPTRNIVAEPGMRLPGMQTTDSVDADHSNPEFSDQSGSTPGMKPTPSPGMIPDQSASSPGMNIGASIADPEMQLKGPITRLRAQRLQQYLQGVLRRQPGMTDSGQIFSSSSPHPVNLLTIQPGYIVGPHPASLPSP